MNGRCRLPFRFKTRETHANPDTGRSSSLRRKAAILGDLKSDSTAGVATSIILCADKHNGNPHLFRGDRHQSQRPGATRVSSILMYVHAGSATE